MSELCSGLDDAAESYCDIDRPKDRYEVCRGSECCDGGMIVGSGGGGAPTNECCEGVRARECFESNPPIADIPARAGAADDIAGWSRRFAADEP